MVARIVLIGIVISAIAGITIGITASFTFVEASEERPDAYPEWGADVYTSTDTAIARVIDPFMNAEPNKIETLTARIVVADDYDDGIKITLTETGANTGIFEGTIQFTEIGRILWSM